MKASKIAKIKSEVIDIFKSATKLKRKDIKTTNFVFFADATLSSINVLYLNNKETDVIMSGIQKKYNVSFYLIDLQSGKDGSNKISIDEIVSYIVNMIDKVQDFEYNNGFGNTLTMQDGQVRVKTSGKEQTAVFEANESFWNVFDKWYMANRKKLRSAKQDNKKPVKAKAPKVKKAKKKSPAKEAAAVQVQ